MSGLIIERSGSQLTLRQPTLGRTTLMMVGFLVAGILFLGLAVTAAQGFAVLVALAVGGVLTWLSGMGLLGHFRGDGILRINLETGAMTRARETLASADGELPEVVVVHEIRHRTDPNGISSTPVSWWYVELVVDGEGWPLFPAHQNKATTDHMALAVREHLGGTVGYRDDAADDDG
ncbi:MAG: hypothetical protein AAFZ07_00500 [Actinomycetota bacterium]